MWTSGSAGVHDTPDTCGKRQYPQLTRYFIEILS